MKTKFLQLHDMGELIIVNADEIRLVEPYDLEDEEEEEFDEEENEDDDEDNEDLDKDDEEIEEPDEDDEEIEELDEDDESSEGGYKAVISYKGIKNAYTFVDETPEEIWEMLE